ncbi:hypothetical protein PO883_15030 [Massilia sp. DJPM01]|uniref:hypothetical protein n=1 Tax=Massilia sp. DJPM01 TaxID=3024404 RepID=UPI00259DBFD9|nr:hypothetical protein [Massilia sp. DJPM01]MDM5178510.1 hypothetical protein [Massilia sp. DJPM01]
MKPLVSLAALVLAASKRVTATDIGAAVDLSDMTGACRFLLNSSALEGAAQTSDVKLQHSDTAGGTYTDTGIAFAQITTAGGASAQDLLRSVDGLKRFVKVVNTLGGASPAVTFGLTVLGKKANG